MLSLAVFPDGRVAFGGEFTSYRDEPVVNSAFVDSRGNLLTGASLLAPDGPVSLLAVTASGQLLVGGRYCRAGDAARMGLARFDVGPASPEFYVDISVESQGRPLVEWEGGHALQEAAAPAGPWATLDGVVSPLLAGSLGGAEVLPAAEAVAGGGFRAGQSRWSIRQNPRVTREAFNHLVLDLESRARAHPRRYTLRMAGLAALGYGYIIVVLVAMAALLAGVVTLFILEPGAVTAKLAFVLGAVAVGVGWAILKGLWVRLPAPTGQALTPANAPRLFELITQLQQQLRAPPFHQVLLDGDFNASVAQIPRLGLLGWQRNYLVVGLPLLQALSRMSSRRCWPTSSATSPPSTRASPAGSTGCDAPGNASSGNWRSNNNGGRSCSPASSSGTGRSSTPPPSSSAG